MGSRLVTFSLTRQAGAWRSRGGDPGAEFLEAGGGGGFGELVLVVLRVFQQAAFAAVFLGDFSISWSMVAISVSSASDGLGQDPW